MTPKHRERIKNLIDALDDYELNTDFYRTDDEIKECNALYTLRSALKARLKSAPVEDAPCMFCLEPDCRGGCI